MSFTAILESRIAACKNPVCFGLDPVLSLIPAEAGTPEDKIRKFYFDILEEFLRRNIAPAVVKPNSAYYECVSIEAMQVLAEIIATYRKEGMLVILDAKRADIGKSSEAYSKAAFDIYGANAVTVNPLMGSDSVKPFLREENGVYVLLRTSNKGAEDFQKPELVAAVSQKILEWDNGAVGAVVGATNTRDLTEIANFFSKQKKEIPFLIPGVSIPGVPGGQGGDAREVVNALREGGFKKNIHVLNSSSGLSYAWQASGKPGNYASACADALERLAGSLGRYFTVAAFLFLFSISYASYPFVGETLDYEVSWGFITAGNARMLVRETKNENELEIISRAWNNGAFETIFPVNDTVKSTVSADSLLPKVFNQKISEGSYRRNALTVYDFETKSAAIKDTAFKSSAFKHGIDTVITLDGGERCILSAFYLARTFKLEPGDTAYFNAISGKKKYKLKVICHKRETIKTAFGKKNCLVIEPVILGDGLFKAKGKLTIWVTDDAERLPVLMKSEIALGSIKASLINVKR
ncbi:MAG: orotidine-5'-phosphate decarboxylase [Candidatus Fibromonas sp.]|nr:orotidine-5'-phosphate decarboxylase [Candidatus Fibromonas sp.]